jgi:hypothetical protein
VASHAENRFNERRLHYKCFALISAYARSRRCSYRSTKGCSPRSQSGGTSPCCSKTRRQNSAGSAGTNWSYRRRHRPPVLQTARDVRAQERAAIRRYQTRLLMLPAVRRTRVVLVLPRCRHDPVPRSAASISPAAWMPGDVVARRAQASVLHAHAAESRYLERNRSRWMEALG